MFIDDDHVLHGAKVEEPKITTSLGEFFWAKLGEHGDKVAQVEQVVSSCNMFQIGGVEVVLTFSQVLRRSRRIGALFAHHGVGVADTVLLCCGNSINYLPVMAAAQFVGAALATVDPGADAADYVHLLDVIKPSLCITNLESRTNLQAALPQHPAKIVHVSLEDLEDLDEFQDTEIQAPARIQDPYQHVAFVMCSSGTSGPPKGVELTSASILAQVFAQSYLLSADVPAGFQLTALNLAGPYWVSCLVLQAMCLAIGAKLVLLPVFTADKYLEHVEKYKVNLSLLSPDKMAALAKHETSRSYDLSSLRLVTCGGNPVSQRVLQQVESRLHMRILPFYAMTEATCVVKVAVGIPAKPGSVGVPFQNVLCKTVDPESGRTLPVEAEGELCFHSSLVMKGYRGNEQATKAIFDEDGFLHSGDIGYFDKDGYIFIVDRVKELIKYKGHHVPACELEDLLMTHNDVMDNAVVGIRNAEGWEDATAFVVKRPGSDVTAEQLIALVKGKMAPVKWLHGGVRFVDELPRTATGKVKKRELRSVGQKQSAE